MPSVARLRATPTQPSRDRGTEFQHPAPHRFVGDVETSLGQQFLDVAVAQGKAQIEPDRVLDDLGGEAMAPVAEQGHANILPDPPITPGPVSVTMPGLGLLVSRAIRLSAPDIEASVMGGEPGRGVTSMLLPPPVWGFSVDAACANKRLEAEIAQRKAAADQLHQAQKMEALGQLTGGIAHDFNNLLTAIIGNLELARRRQGGDPQMANLLQAALSAAERGATLVRDLLSFARRQPLEPKQVNVAGLIDDALKILNQTIRPEIRLLTRAEPGLWPAWVDPNQLELAILNLALNARDAMPGGGRLQICCENRHVEAQNAP